MTKAHFAQMHDAADPLILFNVWDAGSAKAVADAGAKAIATGSHSLAGAQGYDDGEHLPFARLAETVRQISNSIDLPLTVDIETGYAANVSDLERNAGQLWDMGVVGCNLEDRLIRAGGLRAVEEQAERISAADRAGLFVNARTDVFLGPLADGDDPNRPELVDQAIERAAVYRAAGAGCFFIPGLSNTDMIAQVCEKVALPVNVMRLPGMVDNTELSKLGVARISYGGAPWRDAMASVERDARNAFAG